jgi:cell division protein FtsL
VVRINVILLIIAVACALATVKSNYTARKLFIVLEKEQQRMRALEVEWGQLQLEQGTAANHAHVERIARDRLGMRPPSANQTIALEAAQ